MSEYVTTATCEGNIAELNGQIEELERQVQSLVSLGEGIPEIEVSLEVAGMTQTPVDKTLSIEDMAADAKATGDAIADVAADLSDAIDAIGEIEDWTGEDIPLSTTQSSVTVAEAIAGIAGSVFPVGSIYMTVNNSIPASVAATGTWIEVRMPLTWNDMKNGTRRYTEVEQGDETGPVHFWLRTE